MAKGSALLIFVSNKSSEKFPATSVSENETARGQLGQKRARGRQEIVINIGEGMIPEKAFWDNLVHHYIMPGLERKGFIPVKVGGRG